RRNRGRVPQPPSTPQPIQTIEGGEPMDWELTQTVNIGAAQSHPTSRQQRARWVSYEEIEPPSSQSEVESEMSEDKDSEHLHESFTFDTEVLNTSSKQFPSIFLADSLDEIDGPKVVMALTNKATSHAILGVDNKSDLQQISNRYGPNHFEGIVIDTGAAHYSTGGYEQWMVLQKSRAAPINKSTSGTVNVQFGIGSTSSIGSVDILTPIGRIQFHIVKAN
ncbi:hypothetical protein EPUL_006033, partial [Erysiphe pulchra]